MLAFFSTKARSDAERDELVEELADASNPWTHGDFDLPMLLQMACDDHDQMEAIVRDAGPMVSWNACEYYISQRTPSSPCQQTPPGEETMMCAKVGLASLPLKVTVFFVLPLT